jgi:hypothetical protein
MNRTKQAIAVGVMITALGPLLGFVAVVVWVLVGRSVDAALYLTTFPDILVTPYLIGALPATVAALVAGWRIWRHGEITTRFWLAATAALALGPSLLYLALHSPPPAAALYATDEEIAAAYIVAVAFASFVLRLLLWATGLLTRTSET